MAKYSYCFTTIYKRVKSLDCCYSSSTPSYFETLEFVGDISIIFPCSFAVGITQQYGIYVVRCVSTAGKAVQLGCRSIFVS